MRSNDSDCMWQDSGCVLSGLWLCVSPLFDFSSVALRHVAWNLTLAGAAIALLAACAILVPIAWVAYFNVVLGCWVTFSPWTLNFSDHAFATVHAFGIGILVTLLAGSASVLDWKCRKFSIKDFNARH